MTTNNYQEWRCENEECKAILGHVRVVNHVHRLDMMKERGVILTGSGEVNCQKCGQVKFWYPGEDGMNHLLERRQKE
jgi:hypothetical protein